MCTGAEAGRPHRVGPGRGAGGETPDAREGPGARARRPAATTIETWFFRTFASVNRREPVRIWCEYANTRRLRPLRQSHTTSDEISACEYGANV